MHLVSYLQKKRHFLHANKNVNHSFEKKYLFTNYIEHDFIYTLRFSSIKPLISHFQVKEVQVYTFELRSQIPNQGTKNTTLTISVLSQHHHGDAM